MPGAPREPRPSRPRTAIRRCAAASRYVRPTIRSWVSTTASAREEAFGNREAPEVLEVVQQPVGVSRIAARLELPQPDEPGHAGVDRPQGVALQLCVLRYPGRLLAPGEFVSPAVVDFIGRQLHLDGEELGDYAVRAETRHEHLAELRRLYGFRSLLGRRGA